MELLSLILGLPLAPLRGVIALGKVIQEQVDQEMHAPASVRRDLEAAEDAEAAGEIGGEEKARIQRQAVGRVAAPRGTGTGER